LTDVIDKETKERLIELEIIDLREKGVINDDIARHVGMPTWKLMIFMREHGITKNKRKPGAAWRSKTPKSKAQSKAEKRSKHPYALSKAAFKRLVLRDIARNKAVDLMHGD
jgi:hypothetical protein